MTQSRRSRLKSIPEERGGGGVSVPLLNSPTYWMAIICKSFLTLFGKFWVNAPPQCFIRYFSIVTLYHRISRRWGGTRDHFSEEFFWRLASTLTPLDRTSCRVNICRICCIFMVKKNQRRFTHLSFQYVRFAKRDGFLPQQANNLWIIRSLWSRNQNTFSPSRNSCLRYPINRKTLANFYCLVYNWSKPSIATPRKCMHCAFTCTNSKHLRHQKKSQSLATISISWYISITTGRIVNLWGRGD